MSTTDEILAEFLNKVTFTGEVDTKEFVDKLFFGGDTSHLAQFRDRLSLQFLDPLLIKFNSLKEKINTQIDALDIQSMINPFGNIAEIEAFRRDFHDNYYTEVKNKLTNLYKDLNIKLNTTNFDAVLDPFGVKDVPKDTTTKFKGFSKLNEKIFDTIQNLSLEIGKVDKKKLKEKLEDPFGLSDPKTAKELLKKIEIYKNKVDIFSDLVLPYDNPEQNAILKNYTRNKEGISLSGKLNTEKKPDVIGQQAGFDTPEFEISGFSNKAKRDLLEVLRMDKLFEKLDGIGGMSKGGKEKGLTFDLPGTLGDAAGLVLAGVASLLSGIFTNGPFKGIAELFGKNALKYGVLVIAKKLFGIGVKETLKRIPVIGTLFSYGFAAQRFYNGDIVGGVLDLVSGTVGLLDIVAPGLGTVLGLGVDALQAVLDLKAGGSSAQANDKKLNILSDWAAGIGRFLRKSPFIATLLDFGEGFVKLLKGLGLTGSGNLQDVKDGLNLMSNLPVLGAFPGVMAAILDAVKVNDQGNAVGFDSQKFVQSFRAHVQKSVLKWIPNLFGLRDMYAKQALGMTDAEIQDIDSDVDPTTKNMVMGAALGALTLNPMQGALVGQQLSNLRIPKYDDKKYKEQQYKDAQKELEEYEHGFFSKLLGEKNYQTNVKMLQDKVQKAYIEMTDNKVDYTKEIGKPDQETQQQPKPAENPVAEQTQQQPKPTETPVAEQTQQQLKPAENPVAEQTPTPKPNFVISPETGFADIPQYDIPYKVTEEEEENQYNQTPIKDNAGNQYVAETPKKTEAPEKPLDPYFEKLIAYNMKQNYWLSMLVELATQNNKSENGSMVFSPTINSGGGSGSDFDLATFNFRNQARTRGTEYLYNH